MSLSFHPEAELELSQAVVYYDNIEQGLGYDFSLEVYSAIQRAMLYPQTWPILSDDIRRVLVHRFPYGVLYSVEQHDILIIAVMNLHREPTYWESRL